MNNITAAENTPQSYRVLARTTRPTTFSDLIGQETAVQILTNGLKSGRLPQAFIFTGIRGVGKTTTARLLAKAVNCIGRDPKENADPCNNCVNCTAIALDRHIDIIEMDAASRTGVDDIRDVIEAARYKPVSAPYKVYIIDEVHMLSKSAFNALLKTLEEPPTHVIFIFATTEIRKVPKTVLSRCMRFDLRSMDLRTLKNHFSNIAQTQGFKIEDSALTLLARAAEGSVRDGLSLLDQALTLGQQTDAARKGIEVTSALVCKMLGLSESGKIWAVFQALVRGHAAQALGLSRDLLAYGADPIMLLNDLLDLAHALTTLKVNPQLIAEISNFAEGDRKEAISLSEKLTIPTLTRIWQVLLKGITEAQVSSRPSQAYDMILLRVAYASALPSLEEVISLAQGTPPDSKGAAPQAPSPLSLPPTPGIKAQPGSFKEVVALFAQYREPLLHASLKSDVRLVHFEPGILKLSLHAEVPKDFISRITQLLQAWTGHPWNIALSQENRYLSLGEQERLERETCLEQVKHEPLVAEALKTFPGAEIADIIAIK